MGHVRDPHRRGRGRRSRAEPLRPRRARRRARILARAAVSGDRTVRQSRREDPRRREAVAVFLVPWLVRVRARRDVRGRARPFQSLLPTRHRSRGAGRDARIAALDARRAAPPPEVARDAFRAREGVPRGDGRRPRRARRDQGDHGRRRCRPDGLGAPPARPEGARRGARRRHAVAGGARVRIAGPDEGQHEPPLVPGPRGLRARELRARPPELQADRARRDLSPILLGGRAVRYALRQMTRALPRTLLVAVVLAGPISPALAQLLPLPSPTPTAGVEPVGDPYRRETPYGAFFGYMRAAQRGNWALAGEWTTGRFSSFGSTASSAPERERAREAVGRVGHGHRHGAFAAERVGFHDLRAVRAAFHVYRGERAFSERAFEREEHFVPGRDVSVRPAAREARAFEKPEMAHVVRGTITAHDRHPSRTRPRKRR